MCCALAALSAVTRAQFDLPPTDSWASAKQKGKADISLLWYDIEPFIYRNANGEVIGVEYELMEGFKEFVKKKYGITVTTHWVDAGAFENIYPYIKQSQEKGLFGLSFYSITEERKQHVKFSPPYMPDMNILATNNNLPSYESDGDFIRDLPKMKGFTMSQTTMEEDMMKLRTFYDRLPVYNEEHDYEVLKRIAAQPNSFGYVPLSVYVVALQRGIRIKRQRVLATQREGFAAIYTKSSDWDEPINAYFQSEDCKKLVEGLVRKYLGTEVADIILDVSGKKATGDKPADIELLTKEREIVTQRLIDTALEAERTKTQRNITIVAGVVLMLFAGILFSRFRTKNKMNLLLRQRNQLIAEQKERIEEMNQQLNIKILQSRINPHFLFNSLNSIQYHISTNDKKSALQYIHRFSAFLRQVLKSTDEMLIPVSEEARMAEQYLWLEQNRFPDRFGYEIHVDRNASDLETPPLLVHAVLETVLYHHILNEQRPGLLRVDFHLKDKILIMKVSDNGSENVPLPVENVEKRIQLINRAASQPIVLHHRREGEENVLELEIPQPLFTLKHDVL